MIKRSHRIIRLPPSKHQDFIFRAIYFAKTQALEDNEDDELTDLLVKPFVEWWEKELGAAKPTAEDLLKHGLDVSMGKGNPFAKCSMMQLLSQLETFFDINIYLYAYDNECHERAKALWAKNHPESSIGEPMSVTFVQEQVTLNPIHISCGKHGKDQLGLLLETEAPGAANVHCHVVDDVGRLASRFYCTKCHNFFKWLRHLNRHMRAGACLSCFRYPGGTYVRQKLLWEELAEEGVDGVALLGGDISWPNRLTWDIESACSDERKALLDELFQLGVHKAISIAVCSNVPGMEGMEFFFDPDNPRQMLTKAYNHMKKIQEHNEKLWLTKCKQLIQKLSVIHSDLCMREAIVLFWNGWRQC